MVTNTSLKSRKQTKENPYNLTTVREKGKEITSERIKSKNEKNQKSK